MAVTNLESIAEKIAEGKKKHLEEILSVSGSNAIKKNEYGVTTVDNTDAASSLIFKPLNRSKLNNDEIIKAIDVNITELKPNIPSTAPELIPKPLYDEEVKTNENLRQQIESLNITITDLNSQIVDLTARVEEETNNRLNIEQTNDVLSNQISTLSKTIEGLSGQIATAIQKSVEESILRASLQAQNTGYRAQIEALIKQIDSLNSIIEGLQSQLGAVQQQQAIQQSAANLAATTGGDAINDAVVAVGIKNGIVGRINNKSGESRWESGAFVDLTNNDNKPVTITITPMNPSGQNWLQATSTSITLDSQKNIKVDFRINPGGCSYGKKDNSRGYDGKLKISVKRSDGTEKSKEYNTRINIMHPKSY